MTQTRIQSALEASASTAVAFVAAYASWIKITGPIIVWAEAHTNDYVVAAVLPFYYKALSIICSYLTRRFIVRFLGGEQRRRDSATEALLNFVIGWIVSFLSWIVIAPVCRYYGIDIEDAVIALWITIYFTILAVLRIYLIRRYRVGKAQN